MKAFRTFLSVLVLLTSLISYAGERYPTGPNPQVTPGDVCADSPVRRYPENIVYCERNVDSRLKQEIIREYDEKFGYEIRQMNRMDFKIDHYIPLSIGGANTKENLWPQHKSVFEVTDPLEHLLSEKIKTASITQAEAIRVIKDAKNNLHKVPELIEYVESLK